MATDPIKYSTGTVSVANPRISLRSRIITSGIALIAIAASVWTGGLLDAFGEDKRLGVVVMLAALAVTCFLVCLEMDKLSDVLKPAIAVVALSLLPAIYEHEKKRAADAAAAKQAKQEQGAKVAAELASLRAAITQFLSTCNPKALEPPKPPDPRSKHPAVENPTLAFRRLVSGPSCAAKYDEIVRGWIAATWTYRLLAPFLFASNCDVEEATEGRDGDTLGKGVGKSEWRMRRIACRLLKAESTDRTSLHYRRFVNAYAGCGESKDAVQELGQAGRALFDHTRRFGCALVFAVPEIGAGMNNHICNQYMEASAGYLELPDGQQVEEHKIFQIQEDPRLDIESWWSLDGWP